MKHAKLKFRKRFCVSVRNLRSQAATMTLPPGKSEGGKDNHHGGADQWLYVISGRGTAIVNEKRIALTPRSILLIERGENHEIRNTGKTELLTLSVYVPPAYKQNGDPLPAGSP